MALLKRKGGPFETEGWPLSRNTQSPSFFEMDFLKNDKSIEGKKIRTKKNSKLPQKQFVSYELSIPSQK